MQIFEGNSFEIGKQLGKIYKKNGMKLDKVKVDKTILQNQIKIYEEYYPEKLEELRGINEILKIDNDKLFYFFICSELDWYKRNYIPKSCSIFGVKNKTNLFVGRAYDWLKSTEKEFKYYKMKLQSKYTYIGLTDMSVVSYKPKKEFLFYNPDDAINEKGLYIGLTFSLIENWNYGLSNTDLISLIAERCSNVEEAIKFIKKVPLCVPKFFFIADKYGNMAVIESDSKNKVVRKSKNSLIQTNHNISSELKKEDKMLIKYPKNTTKIRYQAIEEYIQQKENIQLKDLNLILEKLPVCQSKFGIYTIWTLILDMKKQRYFLTSNLFGKKKRIELKIK